MRIATLATLALAVCGSKDSAKASPPPPRAPAPAPSAPAPTPSAPSPTAPASAPPVPALPSAPPSSVERIACPTGKALTAVARVAFGAKRGGAVAATCVAVRTDRALWALEGTHASPGDRDMAAYVTALVDARTGAAFWSEGAGAFDHPSDMVNELRPVERQAVDLDGDGEDELIQIDSQTAHGITLRTLMVYSLHGNRFADAVEHALSADNAAGDADDKWACHGTLKVIDGPAPTKHLEITATHKGKIDSDGSCPDAGTHVYRWADDQLVDL